MKKDTTFYISTAIKDFKNDKGFMVGRFQEGVFRKKIRGSLHILRKYNAVGLDKAVVEELLSLGCYEIRIMDTETNVVRTIPMNEFVEHGIADNLGHGNQIFCPLNKFTNSLQEKLL